MYNRRTSIACIFGALINIAKATITAALMSIWRIERTRSVDGVQSFSPKIFTLAHCYIVQSEDR